jgi:hypothetical protein
MDWREKVIAELKDGNNKAALLGVIEAELKRLPAKEQQRIVAAMIAPIVEGWNEMCEGVSLKREETQAATPKRGHLRAVPGVITDDPAPGRS